MCYSTSQSGSRRRAHLFSAKAHHCVFATAAYLCVFPIFLILAANALTFTELEYNVNVFTGDKSGAGTDSNVFVILYGQKGDSGTWKSL